MLNFDWTIEFDYISKALLTIDIVTKQLLDKNLLFKFIPNEQEVSMASQKLSN